MRRAIVLLVALAVSMGVVAQSAEPSREELDRSWRQSVAKRLRDHSPLDTILQVYNTPSEKADSKGRTAMPDVNFWYPGEWEEVQAVVVTPCYMYRSTDSRYQGDYYRAMPVVAGWAEVYEYVQRDWRYVTMSHYTANVDTVSDFAQVCFHVIDAIQQGGAEAWVRVEQLADSAVVLSHLATLGLRGDSLRFFEAPGNTYWYRDCGPICFYYGEGDTLAMLDCEYYRGRALDDSLPTYIERYFGIPNFTTQLEWEGGNCLVDGAGMVVTSDRIYSSNADTVGHYAWDGVDINTLHVTRKTPLSATQVRDTLNALIGTRATHVLPSFRNDGGTGHVDLYVDMLDENLFVFSQMPSNYRNWYDYKVGRRNMDSLCSYQSYFGANYRRRNIPFPSADGGGHFRTESIYGSQYARSYSNHTFVNNLIIQPCFSPVGADRMPTEEWDRANIEELKKAYPGYTIYCVDVRSFDGSGGAIHCITKQIPASHPVRILHRELYGNTGNTYTTNGAPILAHITNADGIDTAQVVYRINGGQWHVEGMTPDEAHRYAAVIPTSGQQSGECTKVEYYIRATSGAGKTITKPYPAAQGAFFTFYLGENPNVDVLPVEAGESVFGHFYPNPAVEEAYIHIDLGEGGNYDVSIVDAAGRTVHTSSLQASGDILYTLNTSLLPSGMYSVVFHNDTEQFVRRLIVK